MFGASQDDNVHVPVNECNRDFSPTNQKPATLRPSIDWLEHDDSARIDLDPAVLALPWALRRVLFLYAKRHGTSSLRSLVPFFSILCWALWIAGGVFLLLNKSTFQSYIFTAYAGILLVFSWVKGETAFEDSKEGPSFSATVLRVPTETFVAVGDPANISDWYVQKLGMRRLATRVGGTIVLKFNSEDNPLTLEPRDEFYARRPPVLYTSKIKKAQSALASRGVSVGEIKTDRQGTRYFEFRDLEGNSIEVSEEPAGALGGEIL